MSILSSSRRAGKPAPSRRGTVTLRHATLARNLASIRGAGLLCSKSQGLLPVIWLHSPVKTYWALTHTIRRHGGRVETVVVIEVEVPRAWLRRSKRGLWYCKRDVGPQHFRRVWRFAELTASPGVSEQRMGGPGRGTLPLPASPHLTGVESWRSERTKRIGCSRPWRKP
jgi:hypothetical protein